MSDASPIGVKGMGDSQYGHDIDEERLGLLRKQDASCSRECLAPHTIQAWSASPALGGSRVAPHVQMVFHMFALTK